MFKTEIIYVFRFTRAKVAGLNLFIKAQVRCVPLILEVKGEGGTLIDFGLNTDHSAHVFRDLLADGEPQSTPLVVLAIPVLQFPEVLK